MILAKSPLRVTNTASRLCAKAITSVTGLTAVVKEPNDVLIAGSKVAGMLAETREQRVVLGIGVNVNQSAGELPERSEIPASSLRIERGHEVDRLELLVELLARLEQSYDAWVAGGPAQN